MDNRTGEILEGRYELMDLIGEGGMGQVYSAKHVVTGRKVAVKFLLTDLSDNAEMIERFYREARAATAVGSEHICEVLDMQPPEMGDPYLVMEFLSGESLKEKLQRDRRLGQTETTNIILQMLEALYAAHKAGIVHRDIKPENIFLCDRGEHKPILVKLLDFGISKFNPLGGDDDHSLTKTGTVLGTPYYMSPEQASGDRSVGPLSDLYAAGVILYEALTGRVPFDAESFSALVVKIVTHTPPHPSDLNPEIPRALGDLVVRSISRNASDRFQSAKEMAEALRAVAAGQSIPLQNMNVAEASFAAVALPGTGQQSVSMDGMTPIMSAEGSGITTTTDPSMQTSTPMAMSSSMAQPPQGSKTWLFVVGGLAAALVIGGIVAVAVIIPQLGDGDDTVATAPPPPPPVDPQPPEPPVVPETPPDVVAATTDGGAEAVTGDAAPAAEEAGPSKVRVTITVSPENARIFVDDERVTGNPAEVELPADGASHTVRADAPGHREESQEFTASEDSEIQLALHRRRGGSRPPRGGEELNPAGPSRPPTKRVNPTLGVVNPWD